LSGCWIRYNFLPTAGSSLGYKHTEEAIAKLSEANSGANNPMYGKTHTPESRAQISDSISGANHPMYGKTHSPETLAKMSGANNPMFGKVPANAFQSEAKSGPNNPMYGKVAANAMTINVYSPYFFSICRVGVSPQANRSPGGAGKINL
jgi:group I intron endonuclease